MLRLFSRRSPPRTHSGRMPYSRLRMMRTAYSYQILRAIVIGAKASLDYVMHLVRGFAANPAPYPPLTAPAIPVQHQAPNSRPITRQPPPSVTTLPGHHTARVYPARWCKVERYRPLQFRQRCCRYRITTACTTPSCLVSVEPQRGQCSPLSSLAAKPI